MIAFPLLRAEWLKTHERPLSRGLLASMLGLAIMPVVLALSALASRSTREFARGALALPDAFDTGMTVLKIVSPLLAVLLVASSVGGEYSQDTWKQVLIRAPGRSRFLSAKLTMSCVAFGCGALITLCIYLLCLLFGSWILQIRIPGGAPDVARLMGYAAFIGIRFFLYASVSLVAVVATRSSMAAVFVALFGVPFLQMVSDRTPVLAWTLPGVHLLNLEARWRFGGEDRELRKVFGGVVSAQSSTMALLMFCGICIAGALLIFRRRDIN